MMRLYLVKSPAVPVVSLADMKAHLRVDFSDDDDLIAAITAAATEPLDGRDGWLGRALIDQTWEAKWARFPLGCGLALPLPPLLEVLAVEYTDPSGAAQTMDPAAYIVSGIGGASKAQVVLRTGSKWPTTACAPDSVSVRFRAGFIDYGQDPPLGVVPAPIVAAIRLQAASLYEQREVNSERALTPLPNGYETMLAPYRVRGAW
jgi:uncharacterized phiE125 gp8 family phage protein